MKVFVFLPVSPDQTIVHPLEKSMLQDKTRKCVWHLISPKNIPRLLQYFHLPGAAMTNYHKNLFLEQMWHMCLSDTNDNVKLWTLDTPLLMFPSARVLLHWPLKMQLSAWSGGESSPLSDLSAWHRSCCTAVMCKKPASVTQTGGVTAAQSSWPSWPHWSSISHEV